ncbi:hypothetical protein EDC94DRAFT_660450 [Helicostylum pulchrum]|nr:hypothetical protein EDC94DRAFT_660450 [Helicostylum pulchrum]
MSFEKLSADCITLILQRLDLKTIQQLAISSKALRSWCLVAHLNYITILPKSKFEFPEIMLKLTTTLRINEGIEITGADWLACVLRHFSKVKTVDIVVKGLSRRYIKAILKTCEAFETVTTVVVDNDELIKWTSYGKTLRTVLIKPRQVLQ